MGGVITSLQRPVLTGKFRLGSCVVINVVGMGGNVVTIIVGGRLAITLGLLNVFLFQRHNVGGSGWV